MISILDALEAANQPEEIVFSGPFALLFGAESPPARHATTPVRTHRIHVNAAKLPDLPKVESIRPDVMRAQRQREQIYGLLCEHGGAMQRKDIESATGIETERVSARLTELKTMGLVRMEQQGRSVLWEAMDPEEEDEA